MVYGPAVAYGVAVGGQDQPYVLFEFLEGEG